MDVFRINLISLLFKEGDEYFINYCNKLQNTKIAGKIFDNPNNLFID